MMPARVVAKNAGRAPLMMWIAGESGEACLSMFYKIFSLSEIISILTLIQRVGLLDDIAGSPDSGRGGEQGRVPTALHGGGGVPI